MGYIDENLAVNEKILTRTKVHWIVFVWPTILLVFGLYLIIRGIGLGGSFFGVIFFLTGGALGIRAVFRFTGSDFALTDKRVLIKTGILSRKSVEILLTKLEGVSVIQGLLGRMLNYGTLVVNGTGGSRDPYKDISAPLDFRKLVQDQASVVQGAK